MLLKVACAVVLVASAAGCRRVLRESRLQGQLDTGSPLVFGDAEGPLLSWDFGDGAPRLAARQASHPFEKAGRYLVQGFDGDFLAERIEVVVVPRPLIRAVPEDTQALVWVGSLREDLGQTVDFFERLAGPANAQRTLEETVLPALAVELGSGDGSVVDPQEGVGVMLLPGFRGQIALLGVVDPERALAALAQKLTQAGAEEEPKTEDGLRIFVSVGSSRLAFVDRGYLYLVLPEADVTPDEALAAVKRIRTSRPMGLQGYAPFRESFAELAQGNLFVFARQSQATPPKGRAPLVQSVVAGLRVGTRSATLEGTLRTSRPVGSSAAPSAMFDRAAEGPVAALKLSVPPEELADLILAPSTTDRPGLMQRLQQAGIDTAAALRAFTGELGALAWFDAEGFLRNLVAGRTEWRGVVQLLSGLTTREPVAPAFTALLGDAVRAPWADELDALLWQRKLATATVTVALTPRAVMVRSGESAGRRSDVDLGQQLGARFEGAFGPGHSSLLLDLGRLKRELDTPRAISGLDAARVVTVQGFSSAFLDQLTPLDFVVLDLVPTPTGARLAGRINFRGK